MPNTLGFLWWDDFRVIYSNNARRQAFYDHPNAYAPLLTTVGLPSNQFTNAYLWSAETDSVLVGNGTFADTAAGVGQQYANAYLHAVKFRFDNRMDGSVPFCPYPNGWGFSIAEGSGTDQASANWTTARTPFEMLGRHADDLLPATYLGEPVSARNRGCSGYAANGIAANYAWWLALWESAKAFIDTAMGHSLTPVEIYDDCEFMGPNLNYILARINAAEPVHRVFDVIRADPRWDTELVNGTQTWADFYATLTDGDRALLENTANTTVFADGLTLVAEKLGVFRDTCHAWQIDRSMVRACREVFGARFRFACEYGIEPSSPDVGTLADRTSALLADRIFENRGPLTLPADWGAAPTTYQLFGLRNSPTIGDLSKYALAGGYTSTGDAAQDGRLFNKARQIKNVQRIRTFGADVVPWWTYNRAGGLQTSIVPADDMTAADHLEVLDAWEAAGVERIIFWGDPAKTAEDLWSTDFGPAVDLILPNLTQPVDPPPTGGGNPNPLDVAGWTPEPGIPLLRMRVFQGDRFRLPFPVLAAEPDVDLAGIVIRAQVRAAPGAALIHEFTPTQTARPGGIRFVLTADTDAWPLGTVLCDVKISGPGIPETLAFRAWVRVVRRI
jgi:hypothetical protein